MELIQLNLCDVILEYDAQPGEPQPICYCQWRKKDDHAMGHITAWVEPPQYALICNAKSAKEMWDSISEAFKGQGFSYLIDLLG